MFGSVLILFKHCHVAYIEYQLVQMIFYVLVQFCKLRLEANHTIKSLKHLVDILALGRLLLCPMSTSTRDQIMKAIICINTSFKTKF